MNLLSQPECPPGLLILQLRLRLTTLLDKKRVMQQHPQSVSKVSSRFIALEEGLKQFSMDLNKLEVIGSTQGISSWS
jgi:hypothetical protein